MDKAQAQIQFEEDAPHQISSTKLVRIQISMCSVPQPCITLLPWESILHSDEFPTVDDNP
jgi:hypothetical protein